MFNKEQSTVFENVNSLLELIQVIGNIEKQLLDNPRNLSWMSDTTHMCRKAEDVLDAVKKRLKELEAKVAQQASQVFTATQTSKYQGDYCTISDNSKPYVKFPQSPTDEGFVEFMQQLSLEDTRPHYPTVVDKIVLELQKGNQLPLGLDKKTILSWEWKLRHTPKRSK